MSKTILALDTSRNTGWAFRSRTGKVESSVMRFDVSKGNGKLYRDFYAWIDGKIADYHPDIIAFEQPHLRGSASFPLVTLTGIVRLHAFSHGVPDVRDIHNSKMKALALGLGSDRKRAFNDAIEALQREGKSPNQIKDQYQKRAMVDAALKIWSVVRDDNEADALFMQEYVSLWPDFPEPKAPKKQRKAK
jgi:Holliday junction resolvasome RuvABC endonuclease subunit